MVFIELTCPFCGTSNIRNSGFNLKFHQYISDINSDAYLLAHEKSGSTLIYLKNQDENRVFSVSFKTPPYNDTGVFHILEHSVLCGSKNYNLKEPFTELAKGTLHTYLNAMTFKDKTMYPIASTNEHEFLKLMRVYLDAVFNPLIYDRKEIFLQEGWRYDVSDEKEISYQGVVLNEMKGSYSLPEQILIKKIYKSLFKNGSYGYDSGGDPDFITSLSYDDFLESHKKYYNASNTIIYLYGKIDIFKYLELINNEYLKDFEKNKEKDILISNEEKVESHRKTIYYPQNGEQSLDKNYLSMSFNVGTSTDYQLMLAFELLNYILLGTNSSPLKAALLDAGAGKDISGWIDSNINEAVFGIIAKNTKIKNIDIFKDVVFNTLNNLVINGIDKDTINAAISKWEFLMLEEDYGNRPKGLVYGIVATQSLIHGCNSFECLENFKHLKKIKENLKFHYFEGIIKKHLIDNNQVVYITMKPEENKKQPIKIQLGDSVLKDTLEQNIKLKKYQEETDSEESLKQIPLISISDINPLPEKWNIDIGNENNIKIISNTMDTNGIIYLNLLFDASNIPEELIPYLGLLSNTLGNINTKNYSLKRLHDLINNKCGGLTFFGDVFSKEYDYMPKYIVKTKFLEKNTVELLSLLTEILINTDFSDTQTIKKIISQTKNNIEQSIIQCGHTAAILRSQSYFFDGAKFNDKIAGIDFYKFIKELEKNMDNNIDEIKINLIKTYNIIINKNNLNIGITATNKGHSEFYRHKNILQTALATSLAKPINHNFAKDYNTEGLIAPLKIQYNAQSANFKEHGYKYSGKLHVLKTIIDLNYFWNNIRVKGGAYGCGCSFSRNGNIYLFSYRDPNLKETYKIYNELGEYISRLNSSHREVEKNIIGTINLIDKQRSNAVKNDIAIARAISEISYDNICKEREEILSTTLKEITELSNMLQSCFKVKYICTIGNNEKIKNNKNIFDIITNLY